MQGNGQPAAGLFCDPGMRRGERVPCWSRSLRSRLASEPSRRAVLILLVVHLEPVAGRAGHRVVRLRQVPLTEPVCAHIGSLQCTARIARRLLLYTKAGYHPPQLPGQLGQTTSKACNLLARGADLLDGSTDLLGRSRGLLGDGGYALHRFDDLVTAARHLSGRG